MCPEPSPNLSHNITVDGSSLDAPLKIAIVAAEATPHAKAGGLADVIGSLPGALKAAGEQPSLIVPGYPSIVESGETAPVLRNIPMRFGAAVERFSVLRASDPHGVPMYLIDHPIFRAARYLRRSRHRLS